MKHGEGKTSFDKKEGRLVFWGRRSDPGYWDRHWEDLIDAERIRGADDPFLLALTERHLQPGSRILEGGCGTGEKVSVLHRAGYDVYGIDYAPECVATVNRRLPELRIAVGDVRDLPFNDGFFDGYWSLGVIEHFFEGYDDIAKEMHRVLRKNGVLFVTAPAMNALRRFKARLGLYGPANADGVRDSFYQFALDPRKVAVQFAAAGFDLLERGPYDGVKGFKDDVPLLRPLLQRIYDNHARSAAAAAAYGIVDFLTKSWSGHMAWFAFRKRS